MQVSRRQVKLVVVLLVCAVAVIVFFQNTEVVETRILFTRVRMSMALLLIVTFIMGYIAGLLSMGYFRRKPR